MIPLNVTKTNSQTSFQIKCLCVSFINVWKMFLYLRTCVLLRVCYYMCDTACALSSYIWGRLVLDRLFDVRFLTRVFGWGMIGWRGRAGLWGRWEGLLIRPTGFCGSMAGLWGLAKRELNFFFPPSSESERSSSVRKTVLNKVVLYQQPAKTIWDKYSLKNITFINKPKMYDTCVNFHLNTFLLDIIFILKFPKLFIFKWHFWPGWCHSPS